MLEEAELMVLLLLTSNACGRIKLPLEQVETLASRRVTSTSLGLHLSHTCDPFPRPPSFDPAAPKVYGRQQYVMVLSKGEGAEWISTYRCKDKRLEQ